MSMPNLKPQTEKAFDVPKQEAMKLLGRSEKTLQRWVKAGLVDVGYKAGPYGEEAFFNREDLLKMRHGKPRQKNDDAPLKQVDLAVITRQSEWANQQLAQSLQNLAAQLPILQDQIKEMVNAKDQAIEATKAQGELREEIGKLKESMGQREQALVIVEQERDLLRQRTKTLQVATWLIVVLALIAALFTIPAVHQSIQSLLY